MSQSGKINKKFGQLEVNKLVINSNIVKIGIISNKLSNIDISNLSHGESVIIKGIYDEIKGNGVFYWNSTLEKSNHNGGTIISPTVPEYSEQNSLFDYLEGVGETDLNGVGCFVRTINDNFVDVSWFGGGTIGLVKAWSVSKYIKLERNEEYYIPSGIYFNSTEEDVYIEGNDSTIIFEQYRENETYKRAGFRIYGTWNHTQSVISLGTNYIEIADASLYKEGDIIKIYNDEISTDYSSAYKGEFVVINNIDLLTNRLILYKDFYHIFNLSGTNTTISKLSTKKFIMKNITINQELETVSPTNTFELIRIEALLRPELINVKCKKSNNMQFIWLTSCYGAKLDMIEVNYLINPEINNFFVNNSAYGIYLLNCEYCTVSNSYFSNCRHGVDGAGLNTTYNSNTTAIQSKYGLSINNIVSNCIADRCTNSSFCSHEGSIKWIYENCISRFSRTAGIGLRGQNHMVINCISIEDNIGLWSFGTINNSNNITFKNCIIINPNLAIYVDIKSVNAIYDNITIIYDKVFTSTYLATVSLKSGTSATFNDCKIQVKADIPTISRIFTCDFAATSPITININNFYMDSSVGNFSNTCRFLSLLGSQSHNIFLDNINLIYGSIPHEYFMNALPSITSKIYKVILSSNPSTSIFSGINDTDIFTSVTGMIGPLYINNISTQKTSKFENLYTSNIFGYHINNIITVNNTTDAGYIINSASAVNPLSINMFLPSIGTTQRQGLLSNTTDTLPATSSIITAVEAEMIDGIWNIGQCYDLIWIHTNTTGSISWTLTRGDSSTNFNFGTTASIVSVTATSRYQLVRIFRTSNTNIMIYII